MKAYCQSQSKDKSLRQHGCGAYSALSALSWATDGEWKTTDHTASARHRVAASGVSSTEFNRRGMTSSELALSMHNVRATDVRMDLPVQQRRGVKVADLLDQLAGGKGALVPVRYGVVQDGGKGVGAYRGGHWVFICGPDADSVAVADPLRAKVIAWPIDMLTEAMETFGLHPWGNGRGEAIVISPWLTWHDGYSLVRVQRNAARAALAACEAGRVQP